MDKGLLYKFLGKRGMHNAIAPIRDPNAGRKVAFVPEGENAWRVVWADEMAKK